MTTTIEESVSIPYHKILGPFKRDTDKQSLFYNKILVGTWTAAEFEYLADLDWIWTEKVDGTNIRVHWDGVELSFAGRTNKAQIPERLMEVLNKNFNEATFEGIWGGHPVTLYGEGYGGKIQKGGNYRPDEGFLLFDVRVGKWWLQRDDVKDVGNQLGVLYAPQIGQPRSVWKAIHDVRSGLESVVAKWHGISYVAEGLVGTPRVPLFNRAGERAIMKIKAADFKESE